MTTRSNEERVDDAAEAVNDAAEAVNDATPGVIDEILGRARVPDLVVLLAVPLVLSTVFTLPEATRRSFAFQYTDPTLVTAVTAHYVHLEIGHLVGNLAGYCLIAGVGYALALLGRRRRFFLTALATVLCVFPLALSGLNLAVPRHAVGYGFSGLNMGLFGLLPLLLAGYARVQFFPQSTLRPLPAVFFGAIGWIGFLALPIGTTGFGLAGTAVTIAAVLLAGTYLHAVERVRHWHLRAWRRAVIGRQGYGDLFVVSTVLLVAYPAVGFPADPTAGGSVLNLYVHLLGFCLGFIGPYTLLAAGLFRD